MNEFYPFLSLVVFFGLVTLGGGAGIVLFLNPDSLRGRVWRRFSGAGLALGSAGLGLGGLGYIVFGDALTFWAAFGRVFS